jgi:ectoine hydroxylase-related dioxygenase (phytanoyl-CoA dioxygenase family)
MDMTTALDDLGVTASTIDDPTRERLDRDGYAVLEGVLTGPVLTVMRTRLAELLEEEGDQAGLEVHQEAGADRLADLVNKDPVFEICFTDPRLLACVAHVLSDFKLSSLNFRAALPGDGLQALHAEGGPCTDPARYQVCNSIWLLDDFTADNGATRVVPGSHRSGKSVRDEMPDVRAAHPEQTLLLAPAGTVVVFNSHLWHGGTLNRSPSPRRALHSYFTRRGNSQQLDQKKYIRPETVDRLSPAAQFILDVLSSAGYAGDLPCPAEGAAVQGHDDEDQSALQRRTPVVGQERDGEAELHRVAAHRNGREGDIQPPGPETAGEIPRSFCPRYQLPGGQQTDNRHRQAGHPEVDRAADQGHDRDEEDVDQGDERAPGQHGPVLPGFGVRVVGVDDRHGDDQQPQDGSGRARTRDEKVVVVTRHETTLSGG